MIKGVLFDKDGTLLGFDRAWYGIITEVFSRFETSLGIAPAIIERLKLASGYRPDGFAAASVVRYLSVSELIDAWIDGCDDLGGEELRTAMRRVVTESSSGSEVAVLPGVRETVSLLADRGYRLGIATADMPRPTRVGLERAGLLQYFSFVGSDDGRCKPKPDPDMAIRFCRRTGIEPAELLVVGDSASDRDFARNAGASFAGIAAPYNDFEPPGVTGEVYVARIDELIPRLGL